MAIWYFTSTGGNDDSDGMSSVGLNFEGIGAEWATSNSGVNGTLTDTVGLPFAAPVGTILYLEGDAHGDGQYRVTSISGGYSVIMEWVAGGKITAADDINNTSGPFATIAQGMQTVVSRGELHIKDGTYTEEDAATDSILYLQNAGFADNSVLVSGYKDVPNDLDGTWGSDDRPLLNAATNALANCITSGSASYFYVIKHLRCAGSSGAVVALGAAHKMLLVDCDASGSTTGAGFRLYGYTTAFGCTAFSNKTYGFSLDFLGSNLHLCMCNSYGNDGWGVLMYRGSSVNGGLYYGNNGAIYMYGAGSVNGVTIDGDGDYGICCNEGEAVIANSLIYNTSTALVTAGASPIFDGVQLVNTIFGKYTTRYTASKGTPMEIDVTDLGAGAVAADFGFANAANNDYRLLHGSPALGTGWPASRSIGAEQETDIAKRRHVM